MVCGNGDGWSQFGVSRGDGIQSTLGKRMAANDTTYGQPRALDDAKADKGDVGIFRAGREIEALSRAESVKNRRDDRLVEAIGDANSEAGLGIGHRVRRHWEA